jgi:hypothetical protein
VSAGVNFHLPSGGQFSRAVDNGQGDLRAQRQCGPQVLGGPYGRYTIRIDATRRGVYPWLITLEGRSVRKGVAPDRDQAADAVSDALDELPR